MRKSVREIKAATEPPMTGFTLVLLSIASFIAGLWVIIVFVRVVLG